VTPGSYVHPAAIVEDMYRPELFGRTAFGALIVLPPGKETDAKDDADKSTDEKK